jgi:hypothetical protein
MIREGAHVSCLSDLALDEWAAGITTRAGTGVHLDGCAACARRLIERTEERHAFAARARPAAFADQILDRVGSPPRRWWLWLAGVPAMAALAALVIVLSPGPSERFKGPAATAELYVQSPSGPRIARHDPGRAYAPGDALQLLYTLSRPAHLLVLDVEEGGKTEVLYRSDAVLAAGSRTRLDRSWVLDGGAPAERIFVLFSARPLEEATVRDAARGVDVRTRDRLALPVLAQASFLIRVAAPAGPAWRR